MKLLLQLLILAAALGGVGVIIHRSSNPPRYPEWPPEKEAPAVSGLRAEMDKVILPRFEPIGMTIEEAVKLLEAESKKAGLAQDVVFRIADRAEEKQTFKRQISTTAALPSQRAAATPPKDDRVTLFLQDLPVSEAARYLAALGAHTVELRPGSVLFFPEAAEAGTYKPFYQSTIPVRPEYAFSLIGSSGASHADMRPALKQLGISFPEGTSASYDPESETVRMINTAENLGLASTILNPGGRPLPPRKPWQRWWKHVTTMFSSR